MVATCKRPAVYVKSVCMPWTRTLLPAAAHMADGQAYTYIYRLTACFVGRSATPGQVIVSCLSPDLLKMLLIGRPAGSRLQKFHTIQQQPQCKTTTKIIYRYRYTHI